MEQARIILAVVLSFMVFFIWDAFFVEKPQPPPPTKETPFVEREDPVRTDFPPEQPRRHSPPPETVPPEKSAKPPSREIVVDTPLFTASFNDQTATLTSFKLKHYFENVGDDSPLKELVSPNLENGTLILTLPDTAGAFGEALFFQTDFQPSHIQVTNQTSTLVFRASTPDGFVVEKQYAFYPDSWRIGLQITFFNTTGHPMQQEMKLSLFNRMDRKTNYGFTGSSALGGQEMTRIKINKIGDSPRTRGFFRWIAFQERYFLAGLIPREPAEAALALALTDIKGEDERTIETAYILNTGWISGGYDKSIAFDVVLAPKSHDLLKQIGDDLHRAVHFGFFDFIAKPCLWLMNRIYQIIPNYGVAIILLTILIKILFWPLGNKSYKSMNEMKKLQPLMTQIREKYKDDKSRMNQEMMGLYKTYKINPLGGCLPMLAQIPVFFALYRMLYEAVELRHAPFVAWINDLSAPDRLLNFGFAVPLMEPPYGIPVLTLIMGGTMFLQMKLQPPPGDPMQAKIMMFLPIVFTVIFINFSSGLVLYWLVNNVLSIAQQHYVTRKHS